MDHRLKTLRAVAAVALAALALAPSALASSLETAVIQYPQSAFEGEDADTSFALVRDAGAGVVKLFVEWSRVAPTRPATPADPAAPEYNWTSFDNRVTLAHRYRLEPLVMIGRAPLWASPGDGWARPDPDELALFAQAAATRYSGRFPAPAAPGGVLPRVRYWQVWNEPNLLAYLAPQYERGRLVSADRYRTMVNRFSAAVKGVDPANRVLAGGTGPFRRIENSAPLTFMRRFLCLRPNLTRIRGCGPVEFDIWGHHPYTSGGPLHTAVSPNDVSLGDLPAMRRVLRAAVRRGTIRSSAVAFWVDEFSWDTRPPDPGGIPPALHARWTAEALYRMWRAGVTLVAWFQLVDYPYTGRCGNPFQSGLYYYAGNVANARAKHSLAAFRFPLVAFRKRGGRVFVWGRTPQSQPGRVVVEAKVGRRWRRLGTLRTSGGGIFSRRYRRAPSATAVRARFGASRSLSFSLKPVRDRFYNPFGVRGLGCSPRIADRTP